MPSNVCVRLHHHLSSPLMYTCSCHQDEPIKFLQANPRPPDTMVYLKYDQYKKAATIAEALDKKVNGGSRDLRLCSDICALDSAN